MISVSVEVRGTGLFHGFNITFCTPLALNSRHGTYTNSGAIKKKKLQEIRSKNIKHMTI
jgi:hypothetical protein